jgi:vacuolar-type H+-ATPase subunit B/Vma2
MNKNYIIKNKDLLKVLKKYEEFNNTFERFVLKHKRYKSKVTIEQIDQLWVCKINIQDESEINKVSEETIRSPSVLQ